MKRLLTALVGIPITVVLVFFAPQWLFALAVGIVATMSLHELFSLGKHRLKVQMPGWLLVIGFLTTICFAGGMSWALAATSTSLLVAAGLLAFSHPLDDALPRIAVAALGLLYCCVLLGFLILLSPAMRLVLLGTIWSGDAAAYYGGRMMGKHPLAPAISPKKTVEGAFAGLIGSVVAGVLFGSALTDISSGALVGASLLAGAAGQVGDLAESAFKRSAGVKDSSGLLPGHGGMLDRIDSVLFAAPVLYWIVGR
jgi:phosphatidate cytidylyltransferase